MRQLLLGVLMGLLAVPAAAQSADDLDRKALIEELDRSPNAEQLARKARSVELLRAKGIPVLDSLPVIVDEDRSLRRTKKEVAERALALMIAAVKGETGDQALIDTLIDQYDAGALFTLAERAFINDPNPSEQMRVEMSWRYEGVHTLLWALGFYDALMPPDQIVDVYEMGTLLRDLGPDGLRRKAQLRPQAAVLDMTDLVYRMNWAAVEARVNGEPVPAGIHPGIVYERHYALNWLIGYAGLGWDEMRTDT
ncbi:MULTISPECIES: DUF4272 domain-containing protein [unclassified Roseovarius]|uniref:DUF4272 domain-containing protein n=1 Tax=unclassified Roseovarius TaxID=2614913 RepID=UPI00273F92E0|nr:MULTISPECIES: DUF4272 domain-containing protein [unclassified Roseovarius]